jgi:hypothetical protein
MATGERAFRGASDADTLSAVLRDEPPALKNDASAAGLPGPFAAVLRKCLAKERDARVQSAEVLSAELERAAARQPVPEPVPPVTPPRRRRVPIGAVVALAVLIVAIIGGLLFRDSSQAPEVRSLAVLPLQNLSGDPEQEYLAEG